MGFYLRKSIRVGPLRFNLSKSGVGVSAGIRGFRLGAGPRGNYVHMGVGGLYYRATLPPAARSSPQVPRPFVPESPQIPPGTHEPLKEIESADVSQIVDSSSKELLDELNQKRAKAQLWPVAAVVTVVFLLVGSQAYWGSWVQALILVLGGVGTYIARLRDALGKTVVLFYELDAKMEAVYAQLHEVGGQLAGCAAAWHIEATGKVHDRKYHAGASNLVSRKATQIAKKEPPYVKTNIDTLAIGVGRQTLHFFPDRVLIYDTNGVGAVSYKDLRIGITATQFIEEGPVPRDAQVVGRTWKYVNKSGGPDRRFKDNAEIPVCKYEELALTSPTGLNEVLQLSRCGLGAHFIKAIAQLAEIMPRETRELAVSST